MADEATREAAAHDRLSELVLTSPQVEDFLQELAVFAARDLPSPTSGIFCGITLVRHKRAATVASSDARAKAMDEVQYKVQDGPCLSALREDVTVYVPDLVGDDRWPEYAAAVALHATQLTDAQSDLRAAMESRTVIDLAAGAIMAENRCSQDQAMTIMKTASSSRNMKLRDVASTVLSSISKEAVRTHFDVCTSR